ncbi:MAG: hypothetical protein JOZ11_21830 [Alphaproteobacteria bacterium]|jgi:hypothetical protein|nr:hypothetical protein [Alphaproteobacteria bacterium]
MMNGPARCQQCRQLDLLVDAEKALEPDRITRAMRREVTRLLKRLMTECIAAAAEPLVEAAADE